MELGSQIKTLRLRRGITQDVLAEKLGVSPQAVSKWEREITAPDIEMLPAISAFFGVSIDALFALSDDTRMERIQNMIWDVRYIEQADVDSAREFLLEKAAREPENGRPHELLADLENHIAKGHRDKAAEYAIESLRRDPERREAHGSLIEAMNGKNQDWCYHNHYILIDFYKDYIQAHPDCWRAYLVIIVQLIDDFRLEEAAWYCDELAKINNTYRVPLYRGTIAWQSGDREHAFAVWQQMEQDFPDNWQVYHVIGDYLAKSGRGEEAHAYYRKALDVQMAPRFVDPCEAMAQLCVVRGDILGAIAVLEEELELFDKEWNFTTGETVDAVRREIARLKSRI